MRIVSMCLAGASLLATGSAFLTAAPAWAGDKVLYGAAPAWIEPVKDAVIQDKTKTPLVLYDVQQHLANGTLTVYVDRAIRLDTPQALTRAGTSTASWQPDKGDLTVHRVEILRAGKVIDVLAGGAKYTVLRRETQLEQRTLDGALTATLAVPGLQQGDILRISYSQTLHDPTLKGKVQTQSGLLREPTEAGFAREIVSWPKGEDVAWKAGPGTIPVKESDVGGDHRITIALPLPKAEDMPKDAPLRYRRPPAIQAGTFTSWADVSRTFAPLYIPKGLIAEASPLAAEVSRIKSEARDPLERAALATRLVQDKVSYQMNGMETGNYMPQTPAQTWKLRYGDCKAKTLLLLALLDRLDIQGEAVLVNSSSGDALPDLLPMPGAFDHVLVRATIAGREYWLDGTSAGLRMSNIADTPPFRNALPLRSEGAQLVAITPRVPATPQVKVEMTFDERGGIDLPALVTARASLSGPVGAGVGAVIKQVNDEQKKDLLQKFLNSTLPGLVITGGSLSFDDDTGVAHVDIEGIRTSSWKSEGARKRENFDELPSQDVSFTPDRARPAWRDIPVDTGAPTLQTTHLKVLLPDGEEGYTLRGRPDLDTGYATVHFTRTATLGAHELDVTEQVAGTGGEVPSNAIAVEKGKAARIANSAVYLLSPADAVRQWQMGMAKFQARVAPYEAAYAKAIAREPDQASSYLNRAAFRWATRNLKGALADYDKAIALDPSAQSLRGRSVVKASMGARADALADLRKALDLDPSASSALMLAGALGRLGKTDEALKLLDQYNDYGDNHASFVSARADVLGFAGRGEEGMKDLSRLIEDRPGQGELYNNLCWYQARFKVEMGSAMETCNKAVEQAGVGAAALDSRALAWLQLGQPAKAKADADAALELAPDLVPTRFVRAIAERRLGDDSAARTLAYIERAWPGMVEDYAAYGVKP